MQLLKNIHIIELLIKHGASVNAEESNAETPMFKLNNVCYSNVTVESMLRVVVMLQAAGAYLEHQSNKGRTSLMQVLNMSMKSDILNWLRHII